MQISDEIKSLLAEAKSIIEKKPVRLIDGNGYNIHVYVPSKEDPKYFYIKEGYSHTSLADFKVEKFPIKLWDRMIALDKKHGYMDMEEFGAHFVEDDSADLQNFAKNYEQIRQKVIDESIKRYRNRKNINDNIKEKFSEISDVDSTAADTLQDLAEYNISSKNSSDDFTSNFYNQSPDIRIGELRTNVPSDRLSQEDFEAHIQKFVKNHFLDIGTNLVKIKPEDIKNVQENILKYLNDIDTEISQLDYKKYVQKSRSYIFSKIPTLRAIMLFVRDYIPIITKYEKGTLKKASTQKLVDYVRDAIRRLKSRAEFLTYNYDDTKDGNGNHTLSFDESKKKVLKKIHDETTSAMVDSGYSSVSYEDTLERIKEKGVTIHRSDAELDNISKNAMKSIEAFIKETPESYKCWYVSNATTQAAYDETAKQDGDNFDEAILWHGSINENWMSIVIDGLLKEKSSNGMFGKGLYFADKAGKSYGYTSGRFSRWSRGNSNKLYLALFKVNKGKTYNTSKAIDGPIEGYDSISANTDSGALKHNEYVIYDNSRCTIYALVEVHLKSLKEDK